MIKAISLMFTKTILVSMIMFMIAGCATVGKDFAVNRVTEIKIGETTQQQVRLMFGSPWRVGIEDGLDTWTYGKYQYRVFSATKTQDLVIRFDKKGKVVSFVFNTTDHNE